MKRQEAEMKNTKEMIAVMQAYCDGKEIEYKQHSSSYWYPASTPTWEWGELDFRIKDPYTELKEAAQDPTKQIRVRGVPVWTDAGYVWDWGYLPEQYEIRDKPKPMKQIKLLAWYYTLDGDVVWRHEGHAISSAYKRAPAEDKIIEVEEE